MARDEGSSLARRIFCCGCQRFWRRAASPGLQIQNRFSCFTSSSRDVLEMQYQEDAASLPSSQGPAEGDQQQEPIFRGHAAGEKISIGRSSSSISTAQKVKQKKKLTSLSSLPLQKCATKSYASVNSEENAECYSVMGTDVLLTPPMINLIPPTPCNVFNNDQFFEINSEEGSMTLSSGSEYADTPGSPTGRHAGSCKTNQSPEIRTICDTCSGNVSHVEGDVSEIPPSNTIKSVICLLDETLELNRDEVSLQQRLNSNWNLEEKLDSDVESNKFSHLNLFGNYQVAQLPECPRRKNFNSGINLLQFTEQNLDDLYNKEASKREHLKTKLRLKPLDIKLDSTLRGKRAATRTCSLGNVKTIAGDLQSLGLAPDSGTEGGVSSRQRRITVASYIPPSLDENGNLKHMVDTKEQRGKSLGEMNTDEVCEWFKNLGLQKSVPFIKEAELQGHQLAAIDLEILDLLQLTTTEEKENLLSSIYKELHPMDPTSQNFDKLLETIGPYDVERFTAALVALSVSQTPPSSELISHPSSHSENKVDKQLEEKTIKKSNLINLSVKAFQRNLQLRVPRDSTVAKVIDACRKILGLKEDANLLSLNIVNSRTGKVVEELQADKQIGELKLLGVKELKLQLCKRNRSRLEKEVESYMKNESCQPNLASEPGVAPTSPQGYLHIGNQSCQKEVRMEEDEIVELQKCFFSLHQEAVDLFTGNVFPIKPQEELYNSESELLKKEQLIQHLKLAQQVLENDSFNSIDRSLLELLKLDYQIMKETIHIFCQKHQQAPSSSLLEFRGTKGNSNRPSVTLSQLIAPNSTAVLVTVQEAANSDGYGFTVKRHADQGLQIETAESSDLQPNDRLVEVNGVCVLNASEEEFRAYLTTPSVQMLVLRNSGKSYL
ncbi:uncharacterized protein [Hemitrygon akajei]|uniref:uncharacterized protein n=1 Tax=Hemitrygon akajei TaxID=2704970 RepID=UPI003BF9D87A